tara:strand:- start:1545 stop:2192 length:648 start_codon:yes stop_codon:yes gene_type:complete
MIIKLKNIIKKSPLLYKFSKFTLFQIRQLWSKKKWRLLKHQREIKIELGSGSKKGKNGWTTIDIESSDIIWDLRQGIPLPNNSVDQIYSSHLLEHISYQELLTFLSECHRAMKVGGKFLVCVPNFKLYIDAYVDGKFFKNRDSWWKPGLIDTGSNMDQLNYIAYMEGQHKYMFDEENLINTLRKVGFSDVKLREFDHELDLKERDSESIYALAIK